MNRKSSLQIRFFEKLKQKVTNQKLLANELASILKISTSEGYSKINGNSSLTLQQLEILCSTYHINFEITPNPQINICSVRFTPFHKGKVSIDDYVNRLNAQMQFLADKGISHLSCSTDDIPFFHLFKYPELTAFKLHFWSGRIHSQRKNIPEEVFTLKKISKKTIANAFNLNGIYEQINCTEIWTKAELLIIIEQLKYSIDSNLLIDKKLIQVIIEQLLQVLVDIENYALNTNKNNKASFDWYYCDVVGNVSYLAELNKGNACFLRFNTFNNFESTDDNICTEVKQWLQSLLNDALGFSGHAGKHRNIYLQNVRNAIMSI
jgi:hypothetical protein